MKQMSQKTGRKPQTFTSKEDLKKKKSKSKGCRCGDSRLKSQPLRRHSRRSSTSVSPVWSTQLIAGLRREILFEKKKQNKPKRARGDRSNQQTATDNKVTRRRPRLAPLTKQFQEKSLKPQPEDLPTRRRRDVHQSAA